MQTISANTSPLRILVASPRHGNSQCMAKFFAQGVESIGGKVAITNLYTKRIAACTACGHCTKAPHNCIIQDDAQQIFADINNAPLLFIASPIYFYHLPAPFKCLIDRSQGLWEKNQAQNPNKETSPKPVIVSLVAARNQGSKLFEGSLLTLKYFLANFNAKIIKDCQFMACDAQDALSKNKIAQAKLFNLGLEAQRLINGKISPKI